nr:MAG TPA: hypothetical protein [Caudoviricetes sp.]
MYVKLYIKGFRSFRVVGIELSRSITLSQMTS